MDYILQYILPSILGDFISGIDKNHMKTSFFSGKVSLEGVSLNPNIFKPLGTPVKLTYSDIGKLEVKIPWMKRLKEPIEIYLEDLLVLLETTSSLGEFDIVEERIKFLDGLTEECTIKLRSLHQETAEKEGGSIAYYKVLILDNIQLKIKNIHVRFEDTKKGFSAGFTLDEVNIHTTNERGEPEFLDRTVEENKIKDLFKRASIKDLGFYWIAHETSDNLVSRENIKDEYRKKFLKEYILRRENKEQLDLIQPIFMISLESTLIFKSQTKKTTEDEPRYTVKVTLKPIDIKISSEQVNQLMSTAERFTVIIRGRKRKYELPNLTGDELSNETEQYKKILTEFLMKFEDTDCRWADEMVNPKRKNDTEIIKNFLSRLPNNIISEASKEIILQTEKKKLLIKMEKKMNKKGWFGYFKGNEDKGSSNEELSKAEAFFDSFIQENSENIGKNLNKGFIMLIELTLTEANIYLLHNKSQQGVLAAVKSMKISFESHILDNIDETEFNLSIFDIQLSFIQRYPKSLEYKKNPVMRKVNQDSESPLAWFKIEKKIFDKKKEEAKITGDIQGSEFTYMPEFLNVLKKFFTLQKEVETGSNFADMAYEKIADMSKNATESLKAMVNEYSYTLSISITCGSTILIFPLIPDRAFDTDCWIVSIGRMEIVSYSDNPDFKSFTYTIYKINMKYYPKLQIYDEFKSKITQSANGNGYESIINNEGQIFTFLNDTQIELGVKLLTIPDHNSNEPETEVSIKIGKISVDLKAHVYKQLLALSNCFGQINEKEFNEYFETEKQIIIKNSEGLFKVYYQSSNLSNQWDQYIMVCSGFYLYFFREASDIKASKYVFIKQAKVTMGNNNLDFPYVIKIKNKFEEILIAVENDATLQRLIKVIEKKNEEYAKSILSMTINESMVNEDQESNRHENTKMQSLSDLDIEKDRIKVKVIFEGLSLKILEDPFKLVDEISLNSLTIEYISRSLSSIIKLGISEVILTDYIAVKGYETQINILSSKGETGLNGVSDSELVKFELVIYDENHPTFIKNLNEKEFKLKFNELSINWIPERISFMIEFLSGSSNKKKSSSVNDFEPEMMQKPEIIKIENKDNKYIGKKAANKTVRFTVGDIVVNRLSLTMITRISFIKLANLSVTNLVMQLITDKNMSRYSGGLNNFQIFDLTNWQQKVSRNEIHPCEIVGIEKGLSLVQFEFEMREEAYIQELKTSIRNSLILKFESVRINWMQQAAIRVINYFMNFLLTLDFGKVIPYEIKFAEALAQTLNPRFTYIEVTASHPKIIFKPKPNSKVLFELDLGLITVKNRHEPNTIRMLKPFKNIQNVYMDTYEIKTSEIKLTKVVKETIRIPISAEFKLTLFFERCLWYDEWIIANEIPQKDKYMTLDNCFKLNGSLTPILIKFTQEDYLDIMDCVWYNFSFDDLRDSQFFIDEIFTPEEALLNAPSPIDLNLKIEYLAILMMDQTIDFPLGKIMALHTEILFYRHRELNKDIKVKIEKLTGSYFELFNELLLEKTLIGYSFVQREIAFVQGLNIIDELLKPDLIEVEKNQLSRDKENHILVDVKMNPNGDKEILVEVNEMKLMLITRILMRLKDYFYIYSPEDGSEKKGSLNNIIYLPIANSESYNSKGNYRIILSKIDVNMPASSETSLIIRGNQNDKQQILGRILIDWDRYDISSMLYSKKEFLKSSEMKIGLDRTEIFVMTERVNRNSSNKRSIIFPVSMQYNFKEYLTFEKTNNVYLAKTETLYIIDKIVFRASAVDSLVVMDTTENIKKEFEEYKKQQPFPQLSQHTELSFIPQAPDEGFPTYKIVQSTVKIITDGVQVRCINDFSGVSIPILDLSLHSKVGQNEIKFETTSGLLQADNYFEISSAFFNPKVGMWEPIIEKYLFQLEMEFSNRNDFRSRVDIVSQQALNIDISDEMVQVVMSTMHDWQQKFQQAANERNNHKIKKKDLRHRFISNSKRMLELLSSNLTTNDVEYVSPCTIWNDTGYPLQVEPIVLGVNMKAVELKQNLYLQPGEEKDLLMEWSIDHVFELSTSQSVLEKMKVTLKLEHPTEGLITITHLDIHNLGTKRRKLILQNSKKDCIIVCNVFNFKKKKLVRFSSPVVIKNVLNIPIYIQIHEEQKKSTFICIKSQSSRSIPIDKLDNLISFHSQENYEKESTIHFVAKTLKAYDAAEVILENFHAAINSQIFRAYDLIVIEPMIVVRNCLPFLIAAEFRGKNSHQENSITSILAVQEEIQLLEFGAQHTISMILSTNQIHTNSYQLYPPPKKQTQELFFMISESRATLRVILPEIVTTFTRKFTLSAKTFIINHTGEKLTFYSFDNIRLVASPFVIKLEDGCEGILFDEIPAIKIKPQADNSTLSDYIPLNKMGISQVDLFDGNKQYLNLSIKVTNELSDRANNIFTKCVVITPQFIFYNKTGSAIEVFQADSPKRKTQIKENERQPFHFSKLGKEQAPIINIYFVLAQTLEDAWVESGIIDVSGPGDSQFIMQTFSKQKTRFFNLSVTMEDPYLFLTLEEQKPEEAMIQIQNSTEVFTLEVRQSDTENKDVVVKVNEKVPFAWPQPASKNLLKIRLCLEQDKSTEAECSVEQINKETALQVSFISGMVKVNYIINLAGSMKIIKFYINKAREEQKPDNSSLLVRAHLPSVGISLISAAKMIKLELLYFCLAPIMFVYAMKGDLILIQLKIKMIIVDNNIEDEGIYPVMIFPEKANKMKESETPFLDFVLKLDNRKKQSDILNIHFFGFYLSEINICFDGTTLNGISDFVRSVNKTLVKTIDQEVQIQKFIFLSSLQKDGINKSKKGLISWKSVDPRANTSDFIYIEKLEIQPIIMNLTFKNIQYGDGESFVVAFLKNALGKALANFDRAPIRLKGIEIAQVYGPKTTVIGTFMQRYKNITTDTLMSIFMSSNIIGNPVKFFDRLSSGFQDLVDKPVEGFLEGPISGTIGIAKGAGSFTAKTFGATFNSLHNIADSIANGLSNLSGDKDFIEKRDRYNQKVNKNIMTGTGQALVSIGKGLFSGVTGIVEKPIEGGMKQGVKGFMKGIYNGTKGLVVKPMAGVVDGVSKLTEGAANTFYRESGMVEVKSRPPRMFYGRERIYKAYNEAERKVHSFICLLKQKKYSKFIFMDSIFLREQLPNHPPPQNPNMCLWISLERLFLVLFEKKHIVWKIRTNNIDGLSVDAKSINIILRKATNSVHGEAARVPCLDKETKDMVLLRLAILKEIIDELVYT